MDKSQTQAVSLLDEELHHWHCSASLLLHPSRWERGALLENFLGHCAGRHRGTAEHWLCGWGRGDGAKSVT